MEENNKAIYSIKSGDLEYWRLEKLQKIVNYISKILTEIRDDYSNSA